MSDKPEITQQSSTTPEQPSETVTTITMSRADPTFKRVTGDLAEAVGIKLTSAELPQTTLADLVLEIPPSAKLDNTLFSFLTGFSYAVTDFKGQSDPLDLPKFQANQARTSAFCSRRPHVPVSQVLNLVVTSRYPQEFLKIANPDTKPPALEQVPEIPWLWRASYFFQEIAIVVCRDLPLEPQYYEWLAFAPADSTSWRALIRLALRDDKRDLLELISNMRPKEFKAMSIDYLADVDPKERERLNQEWAEVLEEELPRLAAEAPAAFQKLIASVDLEKVVEAIGIEQLAEAIGVEQLAETLTDEQMEEILRRRRASKSQANKAPQQEPN